MDSKSKLNVYIFIIYLNILGGSILIYLFIDKFGPNWLLFFAFVVSPFFIMIFCVWNKIILKYTFKMSNENGVNYASDNNSCDISIISSGTNLDNYQTTDNFVEYFNGNFHEINQPSAPSEQSLDQMSIEFQSSNSILHWCEEQNITYPEILTQIDQTALPVLSSSHLHPSELSSDHPPSYETLNEPPTYNEVIKC